MSVFNETYDDMTRSLWYEEKFDTDTRQVSNPVYWLDIRDVTVRWVHLQEFMFSNTSFKWTERKLKIEFRRHTEVTLVLVKLLDFLRMHLVALAVDSVVAEHHAVPCYFDLDSSVPVYVEYLDSVDDFFKNDKGICRYYLFLLTLPSKLLLLQKRCVQWWAKVWLHHWISSCTWNASSENWRRYSRTSNFSSIDMEIFDNI